MLYKAHKQIFSLFTHRQLQDSVLCNQNNTPQCWVRTVLLCWRSLFFLEEMWKRWRNLLWVEPSSYWVTHCMVSAQHVHIWASQLDFSSVLRAKSMTEMWRKGNVHKIIKSVPNTGNSSILIWGFQTQCYCSNIHIFLLLLEGNNEKEMKL